MEICWHSLPCNIDVSKRNWTWKESIYKHIEHFKLYIPSTNNKNLKRFVFYFYFILLLLSYYLFIFLLSISVLLNTKNIHISFLYHALFYLSAKKMITKKQFSFFLWNVRLLSNKKLKKKKKKKTNFSFTLSLFLSPLSFFTQVTSSPNHSL